MARKKKGAHGGHGWFVTFADLMALLMSFFVMLTAMSSQDKVKFQVMAGSMRDAFGSQTHTRRAGIVEIGGLPTREYLKDVGASPADNDTNFASENRDGHKKQGAEVSTNDTQRGEMSRDQGFSSAAASLRQSWQEMPEIKALSSNILMDETPEGTLIQFVDQDNRPMFPEGSKYPYERTRMVLQTLAPVLAKLGNRIAITGHTTAQRLGGRPGYSNWELSADRANAVRQILQESGLPADRIQSVSGKADTDPLFPQNAYMTPNSRVSVLVVKEAPPLPPRSSP